MGKSWYDGPKNHQLCSHERIDLWNRLLLEQCYLHEETLLTWTKVGCATEFALVAIGAVRTVTVVGVNEKVDLGIYVMGLPRDSRENSLDKTDNREKEHP